MIAPELPAHSPGNPAPLILTAELPPDLFAWANALRQAHFPPERNYLLAHVTLFHAFAPSLEAEVRGLCARLTAEVPPPQGRVTGVLNLGRGTGIALQSPALLDLRDRIAGHFRGSLTAQDQHRPRLHITVQNKVLPEAARQLQSQLASTVTERPFHFRGIALHFYRGGPWEAAGRWSFRGREHRKTGG